VIQDEAQEKGSMGDQAERVRFQGDLRILTLEGSGYEMGRQHGEALREEIHRGVLPFFGNYTEFDSHLRELPEAKRREVAARLDREVFDRLRPFVPQVYLDELRGIAEGAGLPTDVVSRGNFLSELLQITVRQQVPSEGTEASAGCTGFAVAGPATRDGELLHGKNTDYRGGGVWDRVPVLCLSKPADGFAYVRGSSAGLIKCNTCMNEHGITLGGHFLFSTDVAADGLAFTVLENEIMRRASSLREAISIVEDGPRAGAFAFVVSDGKTGEAVALECTRAEVSQRWLSDGAVFMSNVCTASDAQKQCDILLGASVGRNPLSRWRRIGDLIAKHHGTIDLDTALGFLGDHHDEASGRERGVAHTIASIASVTSVLLRPERREIWMGVGPVPAANNPFLGFDCRDALAGDGEPEFLGIRPGNPFEEDARLRAVRRYAEAACLYDCSPGETDAMLKLLDEAMQIDPQEPAYPRMIARLHLLANRPDPAEEMLQGALSISAQGPSELAEAWLLRGYGYDLREEREDAREAYRRALELHDDEAEPIRAVNTLVRLSAHRHLEEPFREGDVEALTVSFALLSGWE
jgi:isopenicillin-N N-acyltransferase-like protein